MKATLGKIKHKIYQSVAPNLKFKLDEEVELERMGSKYGEWVIPAGTISSDSVCYLAGAGEDISFDIALAEKYGCEIHIFDPTPRAKLHFNTLAEEIDKGNEMILPHDATHSYSINKENFSRIQFHPLGIWNANEQVKFYEPANEEHVSHSILNLQQTEDYFLAEVKPLKAIMESLKHDQIDLLKLDIEGAEYEVINDLLDNEIDIKILCVEFDEVYNALDSKYPFRINKTVKALKKQGYNLIYADDFCNMTLIKR